MKTRKEPKPICTTVECYCGKHNKKVGSAEWFKEQETLKAKYSHTPTPWYISENTLNDKPTKETIWIDDMSGNALFALPKMGGRSYEEQMADAALIVRAVNTFEALTAENERLRNSHEELLQALKILVEHAGERYPHFESPRGVRDITQAMQAIAKAEGR